MKTSMKKNGMLLLAACVCIFLHGQPINVSAAQKELPTINLNPSASEEESPSGNGSGSGKNSVGAESPSGGNPADGGSASGGGAASDGGNSSESAEGGGVSGGGDASEGGGWLQKIAWVAAIALFFAAVAIAAIALGGALGKHGKQHRDEPKKKTEKKERSIRYTQEVSPGRKGNRGADSAITIWQDTIRLTDIDNPARVYMASFDSMKDTGKAVVGSGRTTEADIRITDDKTVSDSHCQFAKKGRMYYVSDLNSTNGTKLNGTKIYEETPILSGDTIKIGKRLYRITINQSR